MTLRIMMDGALYTCSLPDTCSFHVTLEPDLQHTRTINTANFDSGSSTMKVVLLPVSLRRPRNKALNQGKDTSDIATNCH